ncbi:MAG: glycosyltransferase family 4 protein [Bacteroidales bacterium]|nr:glycosyltransferase family 4 protein [Bacteroidales bacterium]
MVKPKLIRITTVPSSLRGLLKGQLKFMTQFFDVIAISSPGDELSEFENEEGVRVIPVQIKRSPNPIRDLLSIYRMYRIFKREKPTIVHTHTPKAGFVGMTAAFLAKVPIRLHTVAGLPLMTRKGINMKILIWIEYITYQFAHRVYPNSIGLREYLLSLNIVKLEKLKVIGCGSSNGIDLEYFNPELISENQVNELKIQLNIKPTDFVFITIGRIVKDKGINELLAATWNLVGNYPNIKLLLLGKFENELDPVDKRLEKFAQNSEHIILAGYQKDIRPYLQLADVFVHPSYREGFPNVVMQACAFNKACIVTDINGSNELIRHNRNGIVVPIKNVEKLEQAMEFLCKNPDIRKQYSENNRYIMKQFYSRPKVWNSIYHEYMDLLSVRNIRNKNIRTIQY